MGANHKLIDGRGLLVIRLILFLGILTFMIIVAGLLFSSEKGEASTASPAERVINSSPDGTIP